MRFGGRRLVHMGSVETLVETTWDDDAITPGWFTLSVLESLGILVLTQAHGRNVILRRTAPVDYYQETPLSGMLLAMHPIALPPECGQPLEAMRCGSSTEDILIVCSSKVAKKSVWARLNIRTGEMTQVTVEVSLDPESHLTRLDGRQQTLVALRPAVNRQLCLLSTNEVGGVDVRVLGLDRDDSRVLHMASEGHYHRNKHRAQYHKSITHSNVVLGLANPGGGLRLETLLLPHSTHSHPVISVQTFADFSHAQLLSISPDCCTEPPEFMLIADRHDEAQTSTMRIILVWAKRQQRRVAVLLSPGGIAQQIDLNFKDRIVSVHLLSPGPDPSCLLLCFHTLVSRDGKDGGSEESLLRIRSLGPPRTAGASTRPLMHKVSEEVTTVSIGYSRHTTMVSFEQRSLLVLVANGKQQDERGRMRRFDVISDAARRVYVMDGSTAASQLLLMGHKKRDGHGPLGTVLPLQSTDVMTTQHHSRSAIVKGLEDLLEAADSSATNTVPQAERFVLLQAASYGCSLLPHAHDVAPHIAHALRPLADDKFDAPRLEERDREPLSKPQEPEWLALCRRLAQADVSGSAPNYEERSQLVEQAQSLGAPRMLLQRELSLIRLCRQLGTKVRPLAVVAEESDQGMRLAVESLGLDAIAAGWCRLRGRVAAGDAEALVHWGETRSGRVPVGRVAIAEALVDLGRVDLVSRFLELIPRAEDRVRILVRARHWRLAEQLGEKLGQDVLNQIRTAKALEENT